MIRIFLGNQIYVLLLLPLFIGGYFTLNEFTTYCEILPEINLGFWGSYFIESNVWINYLSIGLLLINAFLANFLFNTNEFYDKNSYLISLLYILFMSFFHSFYQLDGVLISHTLLLTCLFQYFRFQNNSDGRKIAFNGAFLLGTAATFNPPLVIFFPIIWFMITRIRPFVFREILLASIGFILPIAYASFFVYYNYTQLHWNWYKLPSDFKQNAIIVRSNMAMLTLIGLLSLLTLRYKTSKSSLRFKKLLAILKLVLAVGVFVGFYEYFKDGNYEWISISVLPLTFFFPFSFFNKSSLLLAKLLFYALFIFSFVKFFIK
jgi:hypothetical protein